MNGGQPNQGNQPSNGFGSHGPSNSAPPAQSNPPAQGNYGNGAHGPTNGGQPNQGNQPSNGFGSHGPSNSAPPAQSNPPAQGNYGNGAHGPMNGGQPNQGNQPSNGFGSHGPSNSAPPAQTNPPAQGNYGNGAHGPMNGGQPNQGNQPSNGPGSHGPANSNFQQNGPSGGPHNGMQGGGQNPGGPGGWQHGQGPQNHMVIATPAPRGSNEHIMRDGSAVRMRPGGGLSDVHDARRGLDVHISINGSHWAAVERPDHTRIFAERGRPGFVQHPYAFHGHDYEQRAYFYHGHVYSRFYRGYGFHGVHLNVYAPGSYYRPAFYGWANRPWGASVSFRWGWGGNPWYRHYGYYFQPYPVYGSASLWLTDYVIAQDLQAEYEAMQAADAVDPEMGDMGGAPMLGPDVKQQIADEVRNDLAMEGEQAQQQDADPSSSGLARLFSDGRPHVFVVGNALDVVDSDEQECSLSGGDVLQMVHPPAPDAMSADLMVLASKGRRECRKYGVVTVQLTDLQEMQNQMQEMIDQGLQELQAKQGSGGLPSIPFAAQGQPDAAQYAATAPPVDPNVAAEIQQVDQQSVQAQSDLTGAAMQSAPTTVALGQTQEQVYSMLGAPTKIANLGVKVIYYYSDMKVTFIDGRVSDVQ